MWGWMGKKAKDHIQIRSKRYFKLSSQIAQLDNAQLLSLFDNSESNESSTGWGMNHAIVIGESKVFVKRVPVTNIEFDNLFSTRNLYDLPTYCNYGFGSTGFGVFRELVTHIKTTELGIVRGNCELPTDVPLSDYSLGQAACGYG
ncbi:MAG: hypothetical protein V7K88_20900 [Nostoc sp.]|uniref:hypothetical protein n=1 Tax=Nostoc sp. TaxID=1180 RepID=UPI002FF476DD